MRPRTIPFISYHHVRVAACVQEPHQTYPLPQSGDIVTATDMLPGFLIYMLKIKTLHAPSGAIYRLACSIVYAVAFCLFISNATAQARSDVLEVPGEDESGMMMEYGSALPHRGSSMSQVEAQYGAPNLRHPAIGDPPITRWDYDGFSVFFEYQHVLHSVIPGKPKPIHNKDELQYGY